MWVDRFAGIRGNGLMVKIRCRRLLSCRADHIHVVRLLVRLFVCLLFVCLFLVLLVDCVCVCLFGSSFPFIRSLVCLIVL